MPDTPVQPDRATPTLPTRDETIRVVAAWLEAERAQYCARAKARGIPETITIREPHGTVNDLGNQGFSWVYVTRASTFADHVQFALDEPSGTPSSAGSLARELHAAYGQQCKVRSQMNFDQDPVAFVEHTLIRPLRSEYLSGLENLNSADFALAHALASDLADLLEGTHVSDVCWLPLAGLRPVSEPLSVGPITFRSLTPGELGALHEDALQSSSPSRHLRPFCAVWGDEAHAIEIRTPQPKAAPRVPHYRAKALVLALQLLGFEPHGLGHALRWTEPRPASIRGETPFRLPRRGKTTDLHPADLEEALALAAQIPQEAFEQPKRREHVALHRFHLGAAQDSAVDAVVDYTIALEAIFLETGAELTFRLQLLGALFVGRTPAERHEVRRDLAQIYRFRSTLVHGRPPLLADAQEAAEKARKITATALVKALRDGWPDEDTLLEFAFADKVLP